MLSLPRRRRNKTVRSFAAGQYEGGVDMNNVENGLGLPLRVRGVRWALIALALAST